MTKRELEDICKACGACNGTLCASIAQEASRVFEYPKTFPQTYQGIRFTSDAMDCSLPIAIDSHSGCSFNCLYCFSNNLRRAPDRTTRDLQKLIQTGSFYTELNIHRLEKFLDRSSASRVAQAMYPLLDEGIPVQLGALGDPFDGLEEHSGWAKKAIPLFIKYEVPVRIGTKGGKLLRKPEYLKLFENSPDQFWFAFSIVSNSDDLISKVDIGAPVTTERLRAMKLLSSIGCETSLRFRPFLPSISDSYKGEPDAWKVLMERAKESGARAISFEYIFLYRTPTKRQSAMYRLLFKTMENPKFGDEWSKSSDPSESCQRSTRSYKYAMTKKIRDFAHKLGLTFGISDPHFKEWNDTGSCCGMPDTGHAWFSNWSRRQMTEVLVQGRKSYESGTERLFHYSDWKPEWAHKVPLYSTVPAVSWHYSRAKKYVTFGDNLRMKWNSPRHPRGPYKYFAKVLVPIGVDDITGDLVYKYNPYTLGGNI